MDHRKIAAEFAAVGHPLGVADTYEVVHLTHDDLSRPILVVGDTASGKTELLMGLVRSAVAAGSGVILVDGKGDLALARRMAVLTRSVGRRSDLRVVDLVSPEKPDRPHPAFDPLAVGSAEDLARMFVDLAFEGSEDVEPWKERSFSLLLPVLKALIWTRYRQGILFDVSRICETLVWEDLEALSVDAELPAEIRLELRGYIESTPMYEKGARVSQRVLEQHSYVTMPLSRALISFDDEPFATRVVPDAGELRRFMDDCSIVLVLLPCLRRGAALDVEASRALMSSLTTAMTDILLDAGEGEGASDGPDPFAKGGEFDDVQHLVASEPPLRFLMLDDAGHYAIAGLEELTYYSGEFGIGLVLGVADQSDLVRWSGVPADATLSRCPTRLTLDPAGHLEVRREGSIRRVMPM